MIRALLSFAVLLAVATPSFAEPHAGAPAVNPNPNGGNAPKEPPPTGREKIDYLKDRVVTSELEVMERFIDRLEAAGGDIQHKALKGPDRLTMAGAKKAIAGGLRRRGKVTDEEVDEFWEMSDFGRASRRIQHETYKKEVALQQKSLTFDRVTAMIKSSADPKFRAAIDAVLRDTTLVSKETIQRLIAEGDKKSLPVFDPKNPPKDADVAIAAKLLTNLKGHLAYQEKGEKLVESLTKQR